ncbi:MAG: hypothetical protein JXM70_05530 [Pirellulales bacterium]|nr:hypothetical protein [Pirellulales bacterium]
MARSIINLTRIGLFAILASAVLFGGLAIAQDKKAVKGEAKAKQPAAEKPAEKAPAEEAPAAEKTVTKPITPMVSGNYKTLKVDESLKKQLSDVSRSLRNGFGPGGADLFDKICDNYILASWTDPKNHHDLANLRGKFRGQLQSCKTSVPTRNHFNNHLLAKLQEMANDNYHPAVRYNCMLLLGELDEKPPTQVNGMPTPLSAALPILLKAATDDQQVDVVRLAALLGVARHAYLLRDPDARRKVSAAMSTLATTRSSPGTSPDGQSWARCIAVDTLGMMGSAGDKGATAQLLLEIVDNNEDPMRVRVAAARAIGNLTYGNLPGLVPDTMVRQLGRMAMSACKKEIEDCEEQDRTISPRRLIDQLAAVRIGLMGHDNIRDEQVKGGAMSLIKKAEVKKNATAIQKQIDRWIGLLDAEELVKKLEPPKTQTPGMGGPGMGGEMDMMGMGGPGMGGPGMGMPGRGMGPGETEEDKRKKVSDDVIAKIKEDLKDFAALVQ